MRNETAQSFYAPIADIVQKLRINEFIQKIYWGW